MGAAAQTEHGGKVVEDLVEIDGASKDAELDHTDEPPVGIAAEGLPKIDHAATALLGALGFDPFLLAGDDLAHVLSGLLIQGVAVVVEVAVRARLAVEAAGVPATNVGKFAQEGADSLGIRGPDDRFNAHSDVEAAGGIHGCTDGLQPLDHVGEVLDPGFAVEDGGDKFARASGGRRSGWNHRAQPSSGGR
jgi:hypothetical protein